MKQSRRSYLSYVKPIIHCVLKRSHLHFSYELFLLEKTNNNQVNPIQTGLFLDPLGDEGQVHDMRVVACHNSAFQVRSLCGVKNSFTSQKVLTMWLACVTSVLVGFSVRSLEREFAPNLDSSKSGKLFLRGLLPTENHRHACDKGYHVAGSS